MLKLHFGRAIGLFFLGYIVISVLGAIIAILLGALLGTPPSIESPNFSYVVYEDCLVLLNLLGWLPLSMWYFKGRHDLGQARKESLTLGLFWALFAVLLDFVLFALLPIPLYLGAYNFFIVQFPWIYLIYLIAFLSPLVYIEVRKFFAKRSTLSPQPR